MINTSLLRSIIKERGYNSKTLAEEILVSSDTISNLLTANTPHLIMFRQAYSAA